jgi:hypothetical protein
MEVIAVYFEIHMKHVNKSCGISADFLNAGGTEF